MNNIALNLIKSYLPYLLSFLLGVIVAWKGCGGGGKVVTETVEVETPVYVTEYVDRWETDTVRYVDTRIVNVYDTITNNILTVDTIYNVDTISIVEAWLTEVNKYDTLISFEDASVSLKWQNYQNRSEGLFVSYSFKKKPRPSYSLGFHGNIGLNTDFKGFYAPLFGIGANVRVNRIYFGPDYGYNGDHYLNLRVGANILNF